MIGLVTSGALAAAEMTADQWLQENAAVTAMFTEASQQLARGEGGPIKCATPILNGLLSSRPAGVFFKPLFTDREDTMSFTYTTDHFYLHYTGTGANRVYLFDQQTIVPGVPDYIVNAGRILDSVWAHTVGTLGLRAPISDGYYNGGGNGLMDVYIIDIPAYGATVRDSIQLTIPLTATAYMFLENDYQGFPGYESNRLNALRVSAAHEFFHTVQFAIDITELEGTGPNQNPAWIEMSATFMEEENYPLINDYYGYLLFFYDVPQWSVRTGTISSSGELNYWRNLHMYASVVFPIFLSKKFGSSIIKDIWDGCGRKSGANWWLAADTAIQNASADAHNLQDMFQEFALWNLFTKQRARTGSYFPDAQFYDSVNLAARVTTYPATVHVSDSAQPDNLGANYVMLDNLSSASSGLAVVLTPDETQPWGITIVGLHNNAGLPVSVQNYRYDTLAGPIVIPNVPDFDRIAVIVSVLGGNATQVEYSLTINPMGEGVLQPNGGDSLYVGAPYEIRWFFPGVGDSAVIDLSTNNGQTWSTVTKTANDLVYEWTVPNASSDSCLVRVTVTDPSGASDTSDNVFSIRSGRANFVYDPFPNPAWVEKHDHMYFKAEYQVSEANPIADMTVTIMTLAGEKVRRLHNVSSSGAVIMSWDFTNEEGETVAAGPYLAVIQFAGETTIKKFVVLR